MPGPLKTNPKNTTGLLLTKTGGKQHRVESILVPNRPRDMDPKTQIYFDSIEAEITRLRELAEAHEQKLNRMQVDPVTKVVTFIV